MAFGSDEAEQYGEGWQAEEGPDHDDFEAEEALEEDEEAVQVMGGEGFTAEQIAQAEARFTASLVCPAVPPSRLGRCLESRHV